jgi:AraC-like DNA-binding protein
VHLTCAPFALAPAHREIFGDNIVFNAPFSAMFLDTMTVNRAIPGGCHALFKQLRQQLLNKAQRHDAPAIGDRVSSDIGNALDGGKPVAIDDVAQRLGTSTRSLQRALGAAGLTYRHILDRARRDRAAVLLKERSQTLLSIALTLGFSDQASFGRACLRWSGKPPGHYRDTLA